MKAKTIIFKNRRRVLQATGLAIAIVLAGLPSLIAAPAQAADKTTKPMKIGVIGSGRIGGTVGGLWVKAGHEVLFSSRHPDRLKSLVDGLGPKARAGMPREAAAYGEVVLISVPYSAVPKIGRDFAKELKGKVVLETGNPFPGRDGDMAHAARKTGTGIASKGYLPGVRLVRAFSPVGAYSLQSGAHRSGEKIAIPIAGDDKGALEIASRLIREAGFDPVVVGDLKSAKKFDPGTAVFGQALTARQLRQKLGL